MSLKTIFIAGISITITVILMNNTDDMHFWFFGDTKVSKLAVLGIMFITGFTVGLLAVKSSIKAPISLDNPLNHEEQPTYKKVLLSEDDREYIQ